MILDKQAEIIGTGIAGSKSLCKIRVYRDIFSNGKMSLFHHYINQALEGKSRINPEQRFFVVDGQRVNLAGTHFRHNYIKLWAANDYKEFYYQTPETIQEWCWKNTRTNLSTGLRALMDEIEKSDMFDEIGPVVPLRFFVNHFPPDFCMDLHIDASRQEMPVDLENDDLWSVTYYLKVPKEGGELWFQDTDFEYKPEINTLAVFNGNKAYHGVKGVPAGDSDRISITIRYAEIKDLMLPGHPDKFLYKPNIEALK